MQVDIHIVVFPRMVLGSVDGSEGLTHIPFNFIVDVLRHVTLQPESCLVEEESVRSCWESIDYSGKIHNRRGEAAKIQMPLGLQVHLCEFANAE